MTQRHAHHLDGDTASHADGALADGTPSPGATWFSPRDAGHGVHQEPARVAPSARRAGQAAQWVTAMLRRLREESNRAQLRSCERVGDAVRVLGRVVCRAHGSIRVGERVVLDGRYAPIEILAHRGAQIVIGDDVVIFGGTTIDAGRFIDVGAGVRIGRLCRLMDSHFHRVRQRESAPDPVELHVGTGAWLGDRVILAAGAQIGERTVVRSGAVVTRLFGPDLHIRGLPASVIQPPSQR